MLSPDAKQGLRVPETRGFLTGAQAGASLVQEAFNSRQSWRPSACLAQGQHGAAELNKAAVGPALMEQREVTFNSASCRCGVTRDRVVRGFTGTW